MYLKRIKVFGFKSFADETAFDFNQGITSIVGPNGCGKSNILDAFNWVLGEQSPSRLRGEAMTDMIFNGSDTRKALGYANVELTLDNSKDTLPISYDSVSITRKLYRSGESEYFINKTPCRLKDIKELFLDTGIGTKSYSVMEQNQLDFIIKSSPEERRSLIEEAAGIRKYKEKKEESERRLLRIRDDLKEVKNIMAEVQKNIRRLKRQTAKAKRYRKLKSRLKYIEVSKLCREYKKNEEELFGRKQDGGLKEKIARLTAEKDKAAARISDLEEKKENLDGNILEKNRGVYSVESDIKIINSRIEDYKDSQTRAGRETERLKENLNYSRERLKQVNKDLKEAAAREDSAPDEKFKETQNKYAKQKALQDEIGSLIDKLSSDISKTESKHFELKNKEAELRNKSLVSEKRFSELTEKKEELAGSYEGLKEDIQSENIIMENLQKELDKNSKLFEDIKDEISEERENLKEFNKKREELLERYHKTKTEFNSGKKYLPQLLSIEKLSVRNIEGIKGPVSTVLEKHISSAELQKIFSVSADKLGWMLASGRKDALKAIAFLKKEGLPPLTFIITEDIPDAVSGPENLAEDLPADVASAIGYIIKDTVIKDGIAQKSSCVIAGGGALPPRAGRLLGLEQDIENLSKELSAVEDKIKTSKAKLNNKIKKSDEVSLKRKEFNSRIIPTRQKVDRLTGSFKYLRQELDRVKNEIKQTASIADIDKQLTRTVQEIKTTAEVLSATKSKLSGNQKEMNKVTALTAELKVRRDALNEQIAKSRNSVAELETRRRQLEKDIENIADSIKDAEEKKVRRDKQYKEDRVNINEIKEVRKKAMGAIGEIEDRKGRIVLELKKLKNSHKDLEFELEKLKRSLSKQKQDEERLKERMKNIRVRLREDMGTEIKEALKDYSREEITDSDIIEMKNQIEIIGNVNMEAPEEFEKENERFEFIKDHVDDLEKSDRDIRSIINKINKQTKERFLDTFNRVDKNFGEIFTKLFEGGSAKIELLEPDNVLESGIRINARPPGKNIKSIKLTSGGEKTLSAIALMFAIYEVRPTPFCILDEVDSPLDDNNLHRFLRMLKDYTDKTQFIIITHNKLTMEMCDTFYGVTMEEFGVSKIISVKLREAQESARAG
ncbi:MAG: AAA family ATPase [Elusimicrobia bacterium]|jgi:chromosome segregation protein|nr:AAA family ATPase [Elusimicrobiota bacterium]